MNGVGYIEIDGAISWSTKILLDIGLDGLADKGVKQIDIALNSPGGDLDATAAVISTMDRLHAKNGITFSIWNSRLVASAATLIFLAAQQRYTFPHAIFVFHAPILIASGLFDADALRKEADHLDRTARAMRDTLVARTHLTPEQAEIYVTHTVMLSAEDAGKDGIVDAIEALAAPKEARFLSIRQSPANTRIPVNPTTPG